MASKIKNKWSLFNEGNLFIFQEREYNFIKLLKKCGIYDLRESRVLDVGCGSGLELNNLIKFGAIPKNLFGIDIRHEAIFRAKATNPDINYIIADARYSPFKNSVFDLVLQYTLFTSVLEEDFKKEIAREILRVLKISSLIIWYDFFLKRPFKKGVKSIGKKEIKKLFGDCNYYFYRITFIPPLARFLCPISHFLCCFFELLKLFNTHYLVGIKKNEKNKY